MSTPTEPSDAPSEHSETVLPAVPAEIKLQIHLAAADDPYRSERGYNGFMSWSVPVDATLDLLRTRVSELKGRPDKSSITFLINARPYRLSTGGVKVATALELDVSHTQLHRLHRV